MSDRDSSVQDNVCAQTASNFRLASEQLLSTFDLIHCDLWVASFPGSPRAQMKNYFSVLQTTESWAGPGNEANLWPDIVPCLHSSLFLAFLCQCLSSKTSSKELRTRGIACS